MGRMLTIPALEDGEEYPWDSLASQSSLLGELQDSERSLKKMKRTVVQKQHLRLSSVLHTHAYTCAQATGCTCMRVRSYMRSHTHTHTEVYLLVIPLPGLAFARKRLLFGWLASPNPVNARTQDQQ